MYKRHSIWDEDKLDIHSSSYSGGSSGHFGAGYAGHGPGKEKDYHKHEEYNKEKEFNPGEDYRSRDGKKDSKKKEDGEKERTIADAVQQEEKYQKKEEKEEGFDAIAKGIQGSIGNEGAINKTKDKETKKKNTKNIEEAINEAIKEEKEIMHVD